MRNIPELEKIEKTFGFKYPDLFRQLCADGMLFAGEYTEDWFENEYPKIRKNPPLLLFNCDFEILYAEDVEAEMKKIADPNDYRKIPSEIKLVPFGQNGSGDLYCFCLNEKKGKDIPVVLAPHDEIDATYLAKNLDDFIFISLMEAVVNPYIPEERDEKTEYEDLVAQFNSHKKYLNKHRQEILEDIYKRKPFTYSCPVNDKETMTCKGLLTQDEYYKLMKAEIKYNNLYNTFQSMGDEE